MIQVRHLAQRRSERAPASVELPRLHRQATIQSPMMTEGAATSRTKQDAHDGEYCARSQRLPHDYVFQ